ncbi:MAG TPA: porin, partial [Humisphaera sp.]
ELRALRQRVAELERRQAGAAAADRFAADRAVADVLADADRRSRQLQAGGFTAGYSGGRFLIQSEDGNFVLNPNLIAQFRYVADWREGGKNGGADDDTQSGFEVRRLRLNLDGNAFSPSLTYHVQWATSRTGGNLVLEEAWARWQFEKTPFAVRAGTFADTWAHETGVHTGRQLAVDRSVPHEIFAGGLTGTENYVQGVELQVQPTDDLRAAVSYHDGFNSRNTAFTDAGGGSPPLGLNNVQWGVAARAEYKLAGDWRNYGDFSALGTKKDLLVIGAGGDVDAADGVTAYFHTADVQWEPASVPGLSVFAAYYGLLRDVRRPAAGTTGSPYDWGAVVQVGYLIGGGDGAGAGYWEVFGRYSYTALDAAAPGGAGTLGAAARTNDAVHEITLGVNRYFRGHAAKLTVDVTYLPTGSPLDLNGVGILAQPSDDPQVVFRGQFQLML